MKRAANLTKRFLSSSSVRFAASPKILITGGRGQLGRGIADELTKRYGKNSVVLSDLATQAPTESDKSKGYTHNLDATDFKMYRDMVGDNGVTWILHLPALLSATCETNLPLAKKVNIETLHTATEIAHEFNCKLLVPSSIGAFGPGSPLAAVPDKCIQDPTTYYGVSKVYAELLGSYYHSAKGLDFRCLRYPGIISAEAQPGGGTTDYAVDIYQQVIGKGKSEFECYLPPDARLPMMLEDDCVKGTCDFLEADASKLSTRVYNLGAIDFTPAEVAASLQKKVSFEMKYNVDPLREGIAKNWPKVFLDQAARDDWDWAPACDTVDKMTEYMMASIPRSE